MCTVFIVSVIIRMKNVVPKIAEQQKDIKVCALVLCECNLAFVVFEVPARLAVLENRCDQPLLGVGECWLDGSKVRVAVAVLAIDPLLPHWLQESEYTAKTRSIYTTI